jgi:hypothetical protein
MWMYNIQKSMSVDQIAQCLDVCAGAVMVVAGVYVEVTFGDLFSTEANALIVGTTSTVALTQMMWRYVAVIQEQSVFASL